MIHSEYKKNAPPPPLIIEDLKLLIQISLQNRSIIFRTHARLQGKERRISFEDFKYVSVNGRFEEPPSYNEARKNWKYELTGENLDDVTTTFVIAVSNDQKFVTVITCF